MKKVFTILFIIVVLLSGMTVSYSAHYCQGMFIASRLSMSGENASCGMNQKDGKDNNTVEFSSLMCANEITSYTFLNDYVFSPGQHDNGKVLQASALPFLIIPKLTPAPVYSQETTIFPPGCPGPLRSESEVLCVFRI